MSLKLTDVQRELLGEAMFLALATSAAFMLAISALCGVISGIACLVTLLPRRDPWGSLAAFVMVLLLIYVC